MSPFFGDVVDLEKSQKVRGCLFNSNIANQKQIENSHANHT